MDAVGAFKRGRNSFHASFGAGGENACCGSASGAATGAERGSRSASFRDLFCGALRFIVDFGRWKRCTTNWG